MQKVKRYFTLSDNEHFYHVLKRSLFFRIFDFKKNYFFNVFTSMMAVACAV